MRHRGAARKRVVKLKIESNAPAPGTPVLDGGLPVGTLGSSSGREALAMLGSTGPKRRRRRGGG